MKTRRAVLLCWVLLAPVLGWAQGSADDWRWQRFQAVADAAEEVIQQQLPNQPQRPEVYVNWRHLDGDGRVDAIVLVKGARGSCALPATRCVGALLTTGSGAGPGRMGVLGTFFPGADPNFVGVRAGVAHMWIAENRNNYVEVMLPRTPGQPWHVLPERRTMRQAQALPGVQPLADDDFMALDAQRNAVEQLRASGGKRPLPAGAPMLYTGDTAAAARDEVVQVIQIVLDRIAAARVLDSTPRVDLSTCASGAGLDSNTALGEFMARAMPSGAGRARTVVVCTDSVPEQLKPEYKQSFTRILNARLWYAATQVTASTAHVDLQAAVGRNAALPFAVGYRTVQDLERMAGVPVSMLEDLLDGLTELIKYMPQAVASEAQAFRQSVVRPMQIGIVCGVSDPATASADLRQSLPKLRADMQKDCALLEQAVTSRR